jgi:glycine/D-amino acid oxidase-like deaminating enzyme
LQPAHRLDAAIHAEHHPHMATPDARMQLDAVIFGGGVAGLWTLDHLLRQGCRAMLLEAGRLGSGQTAASQGIVHGGVKYTLRGSLTQSAKTIRMMPQLWRECLAGEREPNLKRAKIRSHFCHLWQTTSLKSRAAMIGARAGLAVRPNVLPPEQRPDILRACPGVVARLDEQVVEPISLVSTLADRHRDCILKIDVDSGLEFERDADGRVRLIRLINPETGDALDLQPQHVVLSAGAGNEALLSMLGEASPQMQRRPLHMVMLRGDLPALNGHCVDGMKTRVTITSTTDYADRCIWQVGGQVSEDGVRMSRADLIAFAQTELNAVLPDFDPGAAEWSTYHVDRAEHVTKGGLRPDDAYVTRVGNIITAWPTKMVLASVLAQRVHGLLDAPTAEGRESDAHPLVRIWPRPDLALPPWESEDQWTRVHSATPA